MFLSRSIGRFGLAFHPLLCVILRFRSGLSVSSGEAGTTDARLCTTGITWSAAFRVVTDFLTDRDLFAASLLDQCHLLRDTIPRRATGLAPARGVRARTPDTHGGTSVRGAAGAGNIAGGTAPRGGHRTTRPAPARRVGALAPAARGGVRSTAGARDVTGRTRPGRHESEITGTVPAACRVGGGSVPAGPDMRRGRGAGPAGARDMRRSRGAGPAGARDVAGVQVPAPRRQTAPRRRRRGRVSRAAGAGAVLCCTIEHVRENPSETKPKPLRAERATKCKLRKSEWDSDLRLPRRVAPHPPHWYTGARGSSRTQGHLGHLTRRTALASEFSMGR